MQRNLNANASTSARLVLDGNDGDERRQRRFLRPRDELGDVERGGGLGPGERLVKIVSVAIELPNGEFRILDHRVEPWRPLRHPRNSFGVNAETLRRGPVRPRRRSALTLNEEDAEEEPNDVDDGEEFDRDADSTKDYPGAYNANNVNNNSNSVGLYWRSVIRLSKQQKLPCHCLSLWLFRSRY